MVTTRRPLFGPALLCAAALAAACPSAFAQAPASPAAIAADAVRLELRLVETPAPATAGRDRGVRTLGGPDGRRLTLRLDPVLLRRVVLAPGDLRDAALRLPGAKIPAAAAGTARLTLFRGARAVASAPLTVGEGGALRVAGLAELLRAALAAAPDAAGPEFAAAVEAGDGDARPLVTFSAAPVLEVTLAKRPNALLFDHEVKPKPGVYTMMKDGHLFYGGKRLRLWGIVGYGSPERMRRMGFNAQRVWQPTSQSGGGTSDAGKRFFYTPESAKRGEPAPHTQGDGSEIDVADRHFAELKKNGMFVMFASLTGSMPIEPALADDSFLAGGADWPEWKKAMTDAKDKTKVLRTAIFFDERLQKLKTRHAVNLLNHVNPYTGKKYGEDEAIAVYEVWNENGFLKKVLEGGLGDLPPYFQDKVARQWTDWLRARYKDDAGLKAAWGSVKHGESLGAGGGVAVAPFLKQRADYPAARASDLVRFLIEKADAFHQGFRDTCRAQAPPGVGVNVAPFSFDTQYRPSTHWAYANAQGDVNCFGMYFWDTQSQLTRPPGMYVIDSQTVEGKATVLYETNQGRPGTHRAEYPLRLAALASWQDWDGVFWHYWSGGNLNNDESFLAEPMRYISPSHFWSAVHQERDPVMTSAIAAAGRIFLSGAVRPAPAPATYRVGRDGLFSYDLINGVGQREATFTRGSRIRFEPDAPFQLRTDASTAPAKDAGSVHSGEEIVWDHANGRLIVDSPTAKVYVGRAAPSYRFRDGITLSGLSTPFVAWAMVSADGKPLTGADGARRAFVTAQSDARNTGLVIAPTFGPGSPTEQAKHIPDWGRAPVLVDDADYTLSLPTRADYAFRAYDFALRETAVQQGRDSSVLRVRPSRAGETPWMGVLEFARRGAAAQAVVDAGTYGAKNGGAVAGGGSKDARLAAVPNPLPGLSWADGYAEAHKTLRDGDFLRSAISPEQTGAAAPADRTISITETDVLLGSPADVDVVFAGERMARIVAVFRRPPSLQDAAKALGSRFGKPAESRVTGDQTKEDRVRWAVRGEAVDLEVLLTEAQGTLTLTYALRPRGPAAASATPGAARTTSTGRGTDK